MGMWVKYILFSYYKMSSVGKILFNPNVKETVTTISLYMLFFVPLGNIAYSSYRNTEVLIEFKKDVEKMNDNFKNTQIETIKMLKEELNHRDKNFDISFRNDNKTLGMER